MISERKYYSRHYSDIEWWAKEPPPGEPAKTPGARIEAWDLEDWVNGYRRLCGRRDSSPKYTAQRLHMEILPLSFIKKCRSFYWLEQARECCEDQAPPRGMREDHVTTRLIMEINNRIARLRQGEKS